ncbi:MAG: hypothetical protein LIP77_09980, partial [Planctomycetes bacterium]|nr:hypothetical protein [Planctomycetota bacterium]
MASHAARHGRAAGIGIVISWALAFAVALTADVDVEIYDGNNSLDSSDWSSGIGSIIIRPNEHTVGDRIDVTVTDDGSSATLSGDLIIATASQDDDAVVPVDFTVNGADLTFDKSLQITAGDGGTVAWTLENGAAVRFQDVLDDDGDPGGRVVDPYEEGFDPTAFSRINALDNGVPEESASLIQITVDGSSLVFDRHLYIKDETARFGETDDSTLRVTGTGGLVAVDGMLYLDDGRITIDDGGALTAGLLVVGSVDTATGNAITVESGGSLAVAQWFLLGNGTLTVQD